MKNREAWMKYGKEIQEIAERDPPDIVAFAETVVAVTRLNAALSSRCVVATAPGRTPAPDGSVLIRPGEPEPETMSDISEIVDQFNDRFGR